MIREKLVHSTKINIFGVCEYVEVESTKKKLLIRNSSFFAGYSSKFIKKRFRNKLLNGAEELVKI